MDSELKLKKQTEELRVRDTTLDAFVPIVAMVTELYIVLFCIYRIAGNIRGTKFSRISRFA